MTLYTKIIQSEDIKDINAVISKYNKYNHQRFFSQLLRERYTRTEREREREILYLRMLGESVVKCYVLNQANRNVYQEIH